MLMKQKQSVAEALDPVVCHLTLVSCQTLALIGRMQHVCSQMTWLDGQVSGLSYYAFPSSILTILMGKEN